jgi:membrane fusion protein
MPTKDFQFGAGHSESRSAKSLPLFRDEALDYARQSSLGESRLSMPVPAIAVGAFFVASSIVLISFLFFASYTHRVRATGVIRVSRGVVQVVLPQAGQVERVLVGEGQHVKRGATLADVSDVRTLSTKEQADRLALSILDERRRAVAARSRAQRDATAAQLSLLSAEISNIDSQLRVLDAEIAAQRQRLQIAERALHRYDVLVRQGLVPLNDVEGRADLVSAQRQAVDVLLRKRLELQQSQAQMRMQIVSEVRAGALTVSQSVEDRSAIDQQSMDIKAKTTFLVSASVSGTVTGIAAVRGQRAPAGSRLLSIVPDGSRLQVVLGATGELGGAARVGQPVALRVDAFPFQKFGVQHGVIESISRSSVPAEVSAGAAPHFEIIVALPANALHLDGVAYPFKPGMTVTADVLLEKRRLIEWLLDPAAGMARAVRS